MATILGLFILCSYILKTYNYRMLWTLLSLLYKLNVGFVDLLHVTEKFI